MIMTSKGRRPHSRRGKARKEDLEELGRQSLSHINGRINRMAPRELKKRLEDLHLNSSGVVEVMKRRLKSYYKEQKLPSLHVEGQYYPYMVVVDFEATCEESNPEDYIHEIIEFPAVLIDTASLTMVDEFHSYCRPTLNPTLSEFCQSLTGISQTQVDSAPEFAAVLENFNSWLRERDLFYKGVTAFCSDGCWDYSKFLNIQCCLSEVRYPRWARRWINIKKIYGNFYKLKQPRIMNMLSNVGLEFEGRLHCGRDDARNLARILLRLMEDGAKPQMNEMLINGQLRFISEDERLSIAAKQVRRHGLKTRAPSGDASTQGSTSTTLPLPDDLQDILDTVAAITTPNDVTSPGDVSEESSTSDDEASHDVRDVVGKLAALTVVKDSEVPR